MHKGASLLSVWLADPYRATRDVDLLAYGASDAEAVRSLIHEIFVVSCPEDGLRFDLWVLAVTPIREEDVYAGHRHFRRELSVRGFWAGEVWCAHSGREGCVPTRLHRAAGRRVAAGIDPYRRHA